MSTLLFAVTQDVQVVEELQVKQRAEHLEQSAEPESKNPVRQAHVVELVSRVVLSAQVLQTVPTLQVAH
jgi:hypothetical protein